MSAPSSVIFLDIDGPMIPATMFLVDKMASWHRVFPATTVACLREICERTGAKVVFNTTHNKPFDGVPDIGDALVAQGLPAEHLHPTEPNTAYPDERRPDAVTQWLGRHPEVTDWVALDDARFTDDERLIWISPDAGLHVGHVNEAVTRLGGKPVLILI